MSKMSKTNKDNGWQEIGLIGVDAGLVWVGDPCYILHRNTPPQSIGEDWHDFCARLTGNWTPFAFNLGHAGLGIAIRTYGGDGAYPVFVRLQNGRVAEVRIVFEEEEV